MVGSISEEIEVNVPASKAWELYGTLQIARLVEKVPGVLDGIEVVEGEGAVGTILKLVFPPGNPAGISSYKEKFTKVDDEKRVKETEVIEGGFLDLGFTLYRVRFEIIEKSKDSCITRTTIEYDLKEEAASMASIITIQPLVALMEGAAKYLTNPNKN